MGGCSKAYCISKIALGIHIIIDGKALRGGTEKIKGGNVPYVLNAIGTQKKIEEQIASDGGHFVLQVKRNNPILYEEIITAFETFEKEQTLEKKDRSKELQKYIDQMDHAESMEKNRERMEYREVDSCTDSTFLSGVKEGNFEYIKTVGRSKQVRVPMEKDGKFLLIFDKRRGMKMGEVCAIFQTGRCKQDLP